MAERQGAIVISWGTNRSGVPVTKAMEVLATSLAYYDGLVKEGRISGYRTYGSTARLGGQLVIEGALAELAAISVETESLQLLAKAGMVVEDLRTELMAGGSPDEITSYYLEGMQAMQEAGLN
jgi:hypothetical protein